MDNGEENKTTKQVFHWFFDMSQRSRIFDVCSRANSITLSLQRTKYQHAAHFRWYMQHIFCQHRRFEASSLTFYNRRALATLVQCHNQWGGNFVHSAVEYPRPHQQGKQIWGPVFIKGRKAWRMAFCYVLQQDNATRYSQLTPLPAVVSNCGYIIWEDWNIITF